jgi:tRNA(Arg) A34 adenosine deaminase TadA
MQKHMELQAGSPSQGDPRFMRQAIALAIGSVAGGLGGPFGAVVVRDGQVIATGVNQVTATRDPTAHAEVMAIRSACRNLGDFRLEGCDLYTSCEPCPMCLAAIYWARCRSVFYGSTAEDAAGAGFDDSFLYQEIRRSISERSLPMVQMLAEEAQASFAAWREAPGKVLY